jgi:hypothetical protein
MGLVTVGEARLAGKPTRARRLVADRFVYIAAGYAFLLGVAGMVVSLISQAR